MPKFIGTKKRWSNKHQWSWLQWTRAKNPSPLQSRSVKSGLSCLRSAIRLLVSKTLTSPPTGRKAGPNKKNVSVEPNKVKAFYILASDNYSLASPCHPSLEMWLGLLILLCMVQQGFLLMCSDGLSHCQTLTFHCDIKRWYRGPTCMHPYSQVWHHLCSTDGQVGSVLCHRAGQHLTCLNTENKSITLSH